MRVADVRTVSLLLAAWLGVTLPSTAQDVVRSVKSGPWSAAATWDSGKVPAAGQKVLIVGGHTVTYDLKSEQTIRSLHLDGTLTFAHDKDTRLDVGLIRIQAGGTTDEAGFDCIAHVMPG